MTGARSLRRGGYQEDEREGAYLVCYLVLMFRFLIQVSLRYLPLYLQSSFVFFSVCAAYHFSFYFSHPIENSNS